MAAIVQIFGHKKCKATRAAERFFSERRVKVQLIDLREKAMAKGELDSVVKAVGLAALYDGSGARAIERGLRYANPDAARTRALLLEDAQLLRTPVVRYGTKATVGAAEAVWKTWLAEAATT